MSIRHDALLDSAAMTLARSPAASLADVARDAGMSRTTLFTRYPTREALLEALALDALDKVEAAYTDAGVAAVGADLVSVLTLLVERLLPLGPRMVFLLRERSLDENAEVTSRYVALEEPLVALLASARDDGVLRTDLSLVWQSAALTALVYAAWDEIELGRLAPRDAVSGVLGIYLDGTRRR